MPSVRSKKLISIIIIVLFGLLFVEKQYKTPILTIQSTDITIWDFELGWGSVETNVQNGEMSRVVGGYRDSVGVLSTFDGNKLGNGFERVLTRFTWLPGDSVWYGIAVYLPVGFYASQQGEVSILRWDNYFLYSRNGDVGGLAIWGSDHKTRLKYGTYNGETVIGSPFIIPEGNWHWLVVHQIFGSLSEVYMDDNLVFQVSGRNSNNRTITTLRAGIVAIDANKQVLPISLYFDRFYIGSTNLKRLDVSVADQRLFMPMLFNRQLFMGEP